MPTRTVFWRSVGLVVDKRTECLVSKWDVHIHCDQHFQFSVFEILVLFSFDLVFGPVE